MDTGMCPPSNPNVEAPNPKVMIFRDGAFGRL